MLNFYKTKNISSNYSDGRERPNIFQFTLSIVQNSKNESNNTSNITVKAEFKNIGGYDVWLNWSTTQAPKFTTTLYDNNTGQTITLATDVSSNLRKNETLTICDWTGNISHKPDGSLNVRVISTVNRQYNMYYFPDDGENIDSELQALETIPRTSILNNFSAELPNTLGGTTSRVILNPTVYSSTFGHKLTIKNGSTILTSRVLRYENNQYYIPLETSELNTIFNLYSASEKQKSFTCVLETYTDTNLTTKIGESTATGTFTMAKDTLTRPTISGSVALTEQNTTVLNLTNGAKFIKDYSNVLVTFTGSMTGKYNSTFSKYLLNASYNMTTTSGGATYTYNNLNTNSLYVQAVDSRGFETSNSINASYQFISDYKIPTISTPTLERENGVGTRAIAWFKVTIWNGNFGNGENGVRYLGYQIKTTGSSTWGSLVDVTSQYDSSLETQVIDLGNTYTLGTGYDIRFVCTDGTSSQTFNNSLYATGQIPDGKVLDGYNKTSTGYQYGINQIPDTSLGDGLQVNGELYLNGKPYSTLEVHPSKNYTDISYFLDDFKTFTGYKVHTGYFVVNGKNHSFIGFLQTYQNGYGSVEVTTWDRTYEYKLRNGTWYGIEENNKIYVGSQTLYDYYTITSTSTQKEAVLGAYGNQLISGLFVGVSIPNGYTKAYRLTAQARTTNGNYAQIALNNMSSSKISTYSSDTFRNIVSTDIFKESDLTEETLFNYPSGKGLNLYCINSNNTGTSCRVDFWNITVQGYLVKD